jgi:outer membrane protein OmpA-like peptidoglycan-associated protein
MNDRIIWVVVFVLIGSLSLTGCPPKKKMVLDPEKTEETTEEQVKKEPMEDLEITQEWSEIPALGNAFFSLDKSTLNPNQRKTLAKNGALLKILPNSVQIRIEGIVIREER